jgi:signal transduction histidine kinase
MAIGPSWEADLDERVASLVEERLRVAMHEIRQPLAAVLALAEVARTVPGVPEDAAGYLDQLIDQVQEISGAAWSVLGPPPFADAGVVDVDELLDSVCRAFRLTWSGAVRRRGERDELLAQGSRALLRRCLVNVVDNAVRAAGPDGEVVVAAYRAAGCLRVVDEDDGPGFGRMSGGTGLGLAVTREALSSIGGALSIGLRSGNQGVRVTLSLPVPQAGPGRIDQPVRAG